MRLEVTRKSDLAVRSLCALEEANNRVKAPELAAIVGTTSGFISQVLTPLVRVGWVRSDPGPTGGYSLAAELDDVSVLAVIETIEGPTDTGRCVLEERSCDDGGTCALHLPWLRAREQLRAQLAATSVAEAAAVAS